MRQNRKILYVAKLKSLHLRSSSLYAIFLVLAYKFDFQNFQLRLCMYVVLCIFFASFLSRFQFKSSVSFLCIRGFSVFQIRNQYRYIWHCQIREEKNRLRFQIVMNVLIFYTYISFDQLFCDRKRSRIVAFRLLQASAPSSSSGKFSGNPLAQNFNRSICSKSFG